MKRELIRRGWHENSNIYSDIFHLKFVVRKEDIFKRVNFGPDKVRGDLQEFQIVNHFSNNNVLTTKVGLAASLKNLCLWTSGLAMESFFPKCYVISKSQGDLTSAFQNCLEEFNEEYRFVFSMSLLKRYVSIATQDMENWAYLVPKILVALNICEKRLLTTDEQIE